MPRDRDEKKQQIVNEAVDDCNRNIETLQVTHSLEENIALLERLFVDVDTLRIRTVQNKNDPAARFAAVYTDGLVKSAAISESIVRPLLVNDVLPPDENGLTGLLEEVIQGSEIESTESIKTIVESVTYGDTILFADGFSEAAILDTKHFHVRNVTEPENERVLAGPREGFVESLMVNLSLIRRKVRTHELKLKMMKLGKRTKTDICLCYMDGLVNKQVLAELKKRLSEIDIDSILDTNYITEFLSKDRITPFRMTGYTEKPDVIVGRILEGRIAIFADGSPMAITVPYLFAENFQSGEDYYLSYFYTSYSRLLRIFGFFLTCTVPAFYIAIVAFHHEMLPSNLLVSIAVERSGVPLPASLEAVLMLIVFDVLRETGVRMPTNIGQALSIVGALVIGQSAVEAKLIAAPMVIIVALTGITNLLVPKMNASVTIIRFLLLILSSCFGLFGFMIGVSFTGIHILSLRSLGIPQVIVPGTLQFQDVKDVALRMPWWLMRDRPRRLATEKTRMKNRG